MKENFDNAMKFVLWAEGYKSEDPNDPGGKTILGYCERDHPKEVALMWDMPRAQAGEYVKPLYLRDYWIPAGCDKIGSPLDIVIMDIAVNQGVSRAKTVATCAANWWDALILRSDLYDDLNLYSQFGKGWNKRRVVALRDYITSDYTVLEDDRKALLSAEKEIKDIPLPVEITPKINVNDTLGKEKFDFTWIKDICIKILTLLFQRKVKDEKNN
jgi:lysozyme family protein